MNYSKVNQLRILLLKQPYRHDNWIELLNKLKLVGDLKGTRLATQIQYSIQNGPQIFEACESSGYIKTIETPRRIETLEQLANYAEEVLQSSGKPWIVVSVIAGTVTVATNEASAHTAKLYLSNRHTHVQVTEQLVYRNPSTKMRLVCLTLEPIWLEDLQPRSVDDYELDYAGMRGSLREALPHINPLLRLQLERWDGMNIRGWMGFDHNDVIGRLPSLVMSLDGIAFSIIKPSEVRLDVNNALGKDKHEPTGFDIKGLRKAIRQESSEIQFRDPITYEIYASYLLSNLTSLHSQIMQVSKGFRGFDFEIRDHEVLVYNLTRHHNHRPVSVKASYKLDILVPVYKDWSLTRKCLAALRTSVSQALDTELHREIYIHATNDCSPDDEVNANIESFCDSLDIIYHHNNENLGFIRTVNSFMLSTTADVMLVNSDVIVSHHCIHEMIKAKINLGHHVASLTAFSNNATIFSYPYPVVENTISSLEAIERIAEAFRLSNDDKTQPSTHQVPVSHGFLMYLTRTALDEVGVFDEYFGKGYGEEVDWAVRASLKGFEHHICTTAYAFHKGSNSFGAQTRAEIIKNSNKIILDRYPFYDEMIQQYIYDDELRTVRNRVARELLKNSEQQIILHISHSSGGGIETYINGLKCQHPDKLHLVLRPGRSYSDLVSSDASNKFSTFTLECIQIDAVIIGSLEDTVLSSLSLVLLRVSTVLVHSFVGWKPAEIRHLINYLKRRQINYSVVAHDYMFVCPRIKLIDSAGEFCDLADSSYCSHCLRTGEKPIETSLLSPFNSDIILYRQFFANIAENAEKIICSTPDQVERLERQEFRNVTIREPYEAKYSVLPGHKHDSNSRNILLIGAISKEKGAERLFHVASHCLQVNTSVHFYLVGAASNLADLIKLPNFTFVSSYKTFNELHDLVCSIYSPIAFFPAIWPETWCYTLTEALQLDLPIIACNLGALGSRLMHEQSSMVQLYDPAISDRDLAVLVCGGIDGGK